MITGRISRSADLLAAPRLDLREKLAPQARRVFRNLDEVARGLPGSPGLCIRPPRHLQVGGASVRSVPLDRGL
jgi:hypothetical protein